MYAPKYARQEDPEELKRFVRENGFAVLFSIVDGKPWATHVPLSLSDDGSKLTGHVSRANRQWKDFNNGSDVLAVFTGPHAYISSSWYDHENVPTWNYLAVHVSGNIRMIEGDALISHLKELVDQYEKHSANPVSVEKMTQKFLTDEIRGLVAFEIIISKIEGAYKLSQNRDETNHRAIVTALEKRQDEGSKKVAEAMKIDRSKKLSS
ncbi:MAG TPA: FMN-binding negative transcriptional regulator [Cyclobacteriaceae bacterium]|nr:FMN-binding negative transcriptional regulator [Cyclobacteriaceae bacterium]